MTNLLKNPDFAHGFSHWHNNDGPEWNIERGSVRLGDQCLRALTKWVLHLSTLRQPGIMLKPYTRYRFRAQVHAVVGDDPQKSTLDQIFSQMSVAVLPTNGPDGSGWVRTLNGMKKGVWNDLNVDFSTGAEPLEAEAVVSVRIGNDWPPQIASAHFDGMSLTEIGPVEGPEEPEPVPGGGDIVINLPRIASLNVDLLLGGMPLTGKITLTYADDNA